MMKKELIGSYRDLDVYKTAMEGAIRIFELTKNFPLKRGSPLLTRSAVRRARCAQILERSGARGGMKPPS
jgi:hypothetical protein